MDRAQHSAGKTLLRSVELGDLPGVGMTVIDGSCARNEAATRRRRRRRPRSSRGKAFGASSSPASRRSGQPPQQGDERRAFVFVERFERFGGDDFGDRRSPLVERGASSVRFDEQPPAVAGSGRVAVKPRPVSRSMTPLIVAASIAVRRPRRFCEHAPHSLSLAAPPIGSASAPRSSARRKMVVWRLRACRKTKPTWEVEDITFLHACGGL